ncbi:MAG: type 4a pilus biogenesis protein PilO [Syntrophales bacterium]|nr:type 4a pilus biogenesis protein PilO [Syntrophales bacterium]MDD5231949.1 type 4a pilus biogenesis protein PilO [Syntrophales bacterium]MDD5531462.1 type 4a pilus biogenesis protein PilO [Syntrophales bacterium]HPL63638.1 type 4a pilus biogenesis protein PilO [Syntrophales bacterium]
MAFKLNTDQIKNLPPKQKWMLLALLLLVAGYFYYSLLFQPVYAKKINLQEKLLKTRELISNKELVIKEIQRNKKEVVTLQESLQTALTKLPDQKEIPGMLTAVTETGRRNSLEFLLFEPVPPVHKEFYAEIPVKISVNGVFADVVRFFEGVARLPRIVNISDFQISNAKGGKSDAAVLTASCVLKTYMFVEKAPEGKDEKKRDEKKK